jgi:hypothetical protein
LESSPTEDCLLHFVELSMAKVKWLVAEAPMARASHQCWTSHLTHAWAQVFEFHRRCREKLSDEVATAFPSLPDRAMFPEPVLEPYQSIMTTYEKVVTGEMEEKTEEEVYRPLQAALWSIRTAFFDRPLDDRLTFVKQMCDFFGIEPFWKVP